MTSILAISGSLRSKSYNTALLRAAQAQVPPGVAFEIATLHGIPLYDGDVETREGFPAAVLALKAKVRAADGLILATPEYNNGIPGVLKNAIDWLSRPASEMPQVFGGRPVALMGASPGGFGTILSQDAWLSVLRALGAHHWVEGRLLVSRASHAFDQDGALVDEAVRTQLADYVRRFSEFLESGK
jgi:NAD(P)H-dependent FMN reductase